MKKVLMASLVSSLFVLALCLVLPLAAYSADKLIVKDAGGTNTVFVVQDTGNTGIGTAAPAYQLEVAADGGVNSTIGLKVASSTSGVPAFYGLRSGGSLAAPSPTPTGKGLFWMGATGYTTGGGWTSPLTGLLGFWSSENFTNTAMGTEMRVYTTPNGSTARIERMRINASGTVIMNSLAGTYTGGSAYVCVNNSGQIYASETACP